MFVIFGATGRVGGAAAAELRRRGLRVKAVVRDAAQGARLAQLGCELATADLNDSRSVARALEGAEGALVLCPLRPSEAPRAEALRIIDSLGEAIEASRPRAVVAISDYGAHLPTGTGITLIFHQLEARLREAPTAMTFLRSAEHMHNWKRHVRAARERGVLPSLHHPVTRRFPTVFAPDVGLVAADLLASAEGNAKQARVVHVEGPRRYSAQDIAEVLARHLGRPVVAEELARERWEPTLAPAGLGEEYARLVAELQDAHNAGRIEVEAGAGEVRRGTTELAEALR
ncbi:NAD(P)H-binding protein [Pyxidicoccus parkwayensis]|uniref:NAD(P)H-binding protein n=1 Tax=Pyxidicoccus parkwayensis TaxID=2813578 RepID=A0ABX7P3T8_9BACT|nr:NAD(P)H-binding protein [Pyxidicoccus parkwaysis]QSQ25092.1 NAD(P)H-binding protein [Pyxidicoccus parkwaysis]